MKKRRIVACAICILTILMVVAGGIQTFAVAEESEEIRWAKCMPEEYFEENMGLTKEEFIEWLEEGNGLYEESYTYEQDLSTVTDATYTDADTGEDNLSTAKSIWLGISQNEELENQGVLLLNIYLTTIQGKGNQHQKIWEPFSKLLINYISSYNDMMN